MSLVKGVLSQPVPGKLESDSISGTRRPVHSGEESGIMTSYCNVASWTGRGDLWDIWLVRRSKFEPVSILTRGKKDRRVLTRRFKTVDAAKKYVENELIRSHRIITGAGGESEAFEMETGCHWWGFEPASISWLKLYLTHLDITTTGAE